MNCSLAHYRRGIGRTNRRRGFVMLMTIAVMDIVMITMVTLMTLTHLQISHSFRATQEAQLRQLLLAGTLAAEMQLQPTANPSDIPSLSLPPDLAKRSATLHIQWLPGSNIEQRTAHITAALSQQSLGEVAAFSVQNGRWVLTAVELD